MGRLVQTVAIRPAAAELAADVLVANALRRPATGKEEGNHSLAQTAGLACDLFSTHLVPAELFIVYFDVDHLLAPMSNKRGQLERIVQRRSCGRVCVCKRAGIPKAVASCLVVRYRKYRMNEYCCSIYKRCCSRQA